MSHGRRSVPFLFAPPPPHYHCSSLLLGGGGGGGIGGGGGGLGGGYTSVTLNLIRMHSTRQDISFDMSHDIRKAAIVKGRSINLALSVRGREALRHVGLEDEVVKNGIPMHARMIHNTDGSCNPILYGTKSQFIMSVDRRKLNEVLLEAAEHKYAVKCYFEHKLLQCNFKTGEMEFERPNGSTFKSQVDLICGNDGAFSAVRKQMMKETLFDYQQQYIPHGYMELTINPTSENLFAMPANYLHIWPRNEYMMIALPNLDKSFTCTLFMPFEIFNSINTAEEAIQFFKDKFPDSIPLIGAENLKKTYTSSKALPMISIKSSPYHYKDKVVIMGDAAHAIVPFYGQGMNAGFEDCIVLNEFLDLHKNDLEKALAGYSEHRVPDCQAICDLAMYNYIEMRKSVNSRLFLMRKSLDNMLYKIFPSSWVPLYTMVSFTRTRYHECIAKRKWQDEVGSSSTSSIFCLYKVPYLLH
ncbi:hypothetical protein FSP39_023696 [Pinctada imbricata]|uniref:Kynurenine 3-monooxygenase n=1 Tax=Pinctada imbricata TaxID=66713 RepID=A0AA88YCW6_PINIB|nr:hypothetical protein FSP39_023696 [Pinctada imbricata]